jgi:hypothetical protein
MAQKKGTKKTKVRDLKPKKDAKGGDVGGKGLSMPVGPPQTPVGPPNRGG